MQNYSDMTKAVIEAVKAGQSADDKYVKAGQIVALQYPTEAALMEVKAQFIADAIIPGLKPHHKKALELDLVRKGSKEYNAMGEADKAKWETQNKAKKDARAIAHTMFSRVVGYAFPKTKDSEANTPTATPETKIADLINDAIKKCEKGENLGFDVVSALTNLKAALAIVTANK